MQNRITQNQVRNEYMRECKETHDIGVYTTHLWAMEYFNDFFIEKYGRKYWN